MGFDTEIWPRRIELDRGAVVSKPKRKRLKRKENFICYADKAPTKGFN